MPWRAATACVAGTAHLKAALPCQDSSQFRIHNALLLGAVCDGAGSAAHSDAGAKLAVDATLASLSADIRSSEATHSELETALRAAFFRARDALKTRADSESLPADDFACTLTVFAASREWFAGLQVGDGQLVVRSDADYELVFKPDRGEYVNETTFITSPAAEGSIQVRVSDRKVLFVCAATDGIERVSLRYPDWAPHPAFYKPLDDFIASAENPEHAARDIEEFLRREKLNPYTDDDKTLLLAAWQEER